jgi:uncharacterized membrane protein (DUF2068 family)
MTKTKGAMRWAANFTALSAGLHVLAVIMGGFGAAAGPLLAVGVIYGGFAYGLLRGWRWLAYIAFVVLLIGTSFAVSNIWALGDVPGWIYAGIACANLLAVLALFGALWRSPETVA